MFYYYHQWRGFSHAEDKMIAIFHIMIQVLEYSVAELNVYEQ